MNTIAVDVLNKINETLKNGIRTMGDKHEIRTLQPEDATLVTPSDTETIKLTSGLYIGVTGDVAVEMVSGNQVVFTAVPVGSWMPIRVTKVLDTGTTASSILALY